jgi:hypothetical protein
MRHIQLAGETLDERLAAIGRAEDFFDAIDSDDVERATSS